jgi:molecular chaperone GrpE
MDEAAREQLVARFRAYLETAATGAEEPDQPEAPDLFTLLAEVAALKAEVKVESRQVKAALDQFRELFDLLRQSQGRLGEELDRAREGSELAREAAERDLLLELLDLRDRLQAGLELGQGYRPGWLARRGGAGEFVRGMSDGIAMSLRRLDETLLRRGVRPLVAVGHPFDARTMHAADAIEDPSRPRGQVVAELRRGFLQGERLLRAAEVIVNRFE